MDQQYLLTENSLPTYLSHDLIPSIEEDFFSFFDLHLQGRKIVPKMKKRLRRVTAGGDASSSSLDSSSEGLWFVGSIVFSTFSSVGLLAT